MRAGLHEVARLLRIGRQMKIGEEDLPWPQLRALPRLRLLDLDDEFGGFEN
jgi:hypothetical protein